LKAGMTMLTRGADFTGGLTSGAPLSAESGA